jgi:hypothetical protein
MTRATLTICALAATAGTLLAPAACSPNTEARAAVEPVKKEKDPDSVRTVKRHSSDIERKKKAKADRPLDDATDANNSKAIDAVEAVTETPQPNSDNPIEVARPDIESQPPQFWVWTTSRAQDLSMDESHWNLENVFPLVCAMVNVPFSHGFNAPGYPVPVRQVGPDGEPLAIDPAASAQQMFGLIAWHREELLDLGRSNFKYAIWPQNWGSRHHTNPELELQNIFALGGNPRDRLADTSLPQDAAYESFYAAQGIALNRQWSEAFVESLDARLASAGIPDPSALFFDLEASFTNRKAMHWWTAALEDPRATTELIDGIHTMAEIEEMAPEYDPSQEIWRPVNRQMYAYTASVAHRVLDYALWEGFWKQAAEVWPNAVRSNYSLYGGTGANGVPVPRLYASLKAAPLRFADFASPIMYGFPDYAINAADTMEEHMDRYNVSASGDVTTDRRRLTVAFHKARIDALSDAGVQVAPWVSPPDYAGLTVQDTIEVMKHGTDRGVQNWLLWSHYDYDWAPIIQAVNEYAAQQAENDNPSLPD